MPHVRVPDGPQDKGPVRVSAAPDGIVDPSDWRRAINGYLPSLRAFAFTLSRNSADADDLVQETLTKAWAHRGRFEPGSNLRAWLFTILRNSWYTGAAKRRREVADEEGRYAAGLTAEPSQEWTAELTSLRAALNALPPEHREAIVMVGAAGLSYQEAADISGCAVGTIKSRVNRARHRLAALLDMEVPLEAVQNVIEDGS
ncbi:MULTISPECIES: sigma-70 family RNA polymerase sigma factor [unclassified Brevundimonas]|uniref:sigma-70 family RNA polymerase sigma factor n=1 Tax=unclassified Brevundimonas TaxID=2622653 RepID=UPI0025BBF4EA|nr:MULTISPECIES: sigma-70 family RNA polymerase sigma factor [unclassified Brevundimonas]